MQHRLREGVFERTNASMLIMACHMVDKIRGLERALEEVDMTYLLDMGTQELVLTWADASKIVKEE